MERGDAGLARALEGVGRPGTASTAVRTTPVTEQDIDEVDAASFPASDPPQYWAGPDSHGSRRPQRATSGGGVASTEAGDRAKRLIERFPKTVRPYLEESVDRLSRVRSVNDGLVALQEEVEHILRAGVPLFLRRRYLKTPLSNTVFAGLAGGVVAAAEEADELAMLLSLGTVAAPGTATVLVLGFLASVAEVYAATCARVAQLNENGRPVVADEVAEDVRLAMFGDSGTGGAARSVVRRAGRSGVRRLARRWTVGAVPIVGVVYGAWDSGRTVRRVLALPLPAERRSS